MESLESDDQEVKDRIEEIYIRACTVHHKNKPGINLIWALHLENKGKLFLLIFFIKIHFNYILIFKESMIKLPKS